jgi:hypothetical protein
MRRASKRPSIFDRVVRRGSKRVVIPSILGILTKDLELGTRVVEKLITVTLAQTKARGLRIDQDLKHTHDNLKANHHEFIDKLTRLAPPSDTNPIELLFEMAVVHAYLLGSKSPDPYTKPEGSARTAKALAARAGGWEKAVEKAISQKFKDESPDLPRDKVIIRHVRNEMRRQGIKLNVGDDALRRRIQPHREKAQNLVDGDSIPF